MREESGNGQKVLRFTPATNSAGKNPWYVIDLLTHEAAESDPKKGWFRNREGAQAAADKLNALEAGRTYVRLTNGFVAAPSTPLASTRHAGADEGNLTDLTVGGLYARENQHAGCKPSENIGGTQGNFTIGDRIIGSLRNK